MLMADEKKDSISQIAEAMVVLATHIADIAMSPEEEDVSQRLFQAANRFSSARAYDKKGLDYLGAAISKLTKSYLLDNGINTRVAMVDSIISDADHVIDDSRFPLPELTSSEVTSVSRRVSQNKARLVEVEKKLGRLTEFEEELGKMVEESKKILHRMEADGNSTAALNDMAENILERSGLVLSTATTVGLAGAFSDKEKSLRKSMYIWTGILITVLAAGVGVGLWRLAFLSEKVFKEGVSDSIVLAQAGLSVFLFAGPLWVAWISTIQIRQIFKISEDYAFKATVAQTYEGYKREAKRFDDDMVKQLLGSMINKINESPVRLISGDEPNSPYAEMISKLPDVRTVADNAKEAAKSVSAAAKEMNPLSGSDKPKT